MERAPVTRTRSGCLSCRRRKRKCDGVRPQCSYCERRRERCCYGIKAIFHPSREMRLSDADKAALAALEEERGTTSLFETQFVDDTTQIIQAYEGHGIHSEQIEAYEDVRPVPRPVVAPALRVSGIALDESTAEAAGWLEVASGIEHGSTTNVSTQYRSPDGLESSHSAHDRHESSSAVTSSSSRTPGLSSNFAPPACFDPELPVTELEKVHLIQTYLQNAGTWCEVSDASRHFTIASIHSLMHNKPFVAAAMALASRQLDAKRRITSERTLKIYEHALQSMLRYEPSQCGQATLVCCILLSVYEMMSSNVTEWRRHLKGCVFNLKNKGWNGSSPSLVGASFWAFLRIDLWAAYLLEDKTLLPPESWMDHEDAAPSTTTETAQSYCNLATTLLAKAVNLVAKEHLRNDTSAPLQINALWVELQTWHAYRPRQMLALLRSAPFRRNPFPSVLLAGDSSICGNTFYHTACILLLRTGCFLQGREEAEETHSPLCHAKEICGISVTNELHACWVHQVYPLHIVGQVFAAADEVEDGDVLAVEKLALLKHLARIERDTGWPTAEKRTALRKRWGID